MSYRYYSSYIVHHSENKNFIKKIKGQWTFQKQNNIRKAMTLKTFSFSLNTLFTDFKHINEICEKTSNV